ncbi:DUF2813 domain-containing protein [Corallococcus exercitus]|uniref:AAA family ATPase n=1 Tax=Corallococcus exercitus TaxID=2316736 RepID=UPI000EA03E1C|nr:ATP-binding protein [Corallococcus exercitus]RKG75648.1 DUF2813 domain-containing protein [Corallococcus exercitus]
MLTSITVENFRGIERLHVEGLGRVNLIIGRNDSGKTALLEAFFLAVNPDSVTEILASRQRERNPDAEVKNFDEFWLPIFYQMDARRGFRIEGVDHQASKTTISLKKTSSELTKTTEDIGIHPGHSEAWALTCTVKHDEEVQDALTKGSSKGVQFPPELDLSAEGGNWIQATPSISKIEIRALSKLKQHGRDGLIIDFIRNVNDQVSGIELLAPSGNRVAIFLRTKRDGLVPLLMMGEGMKRCFEFAVNLAVTDDLPIYIDEVENGLHHSVLHPMWTWIAKASRERNVQFFITTHSEECVQAAAAVFKEQNDNDLRVIRLDKQEHETKAVVYDRNLVDAAGRMGVEIRG